MKFNSPRKEYRWTNGRNEAELISLFSLTCHRMLRDLVSNVPQILLLIPEINVELHRTTPLTLRWQRIELPSQFARFPHKLSEAEAVPFVTAHGRCSQQSVDRWEPINAR
jgi:hypothetical protein